MDWNQSLANHSWFGDVTQEDEKMKVARQVSSWVKNGDVIGVGSGSTAYLALKAMAKKVKEKGLKVEAIPTSLEAAGNCAALGVSVTTLQAKRPDWGFDGADEVDGHNRLIKGRGGALFAEKLVMASSPKTFILADSSKLVDRLGERFPVPLEIDPRAVHLVESRLQPFPVENVSLRMAQAKDGPVITEAGNIILDVTFRTIEDEFEKELSAIPGVVETGLFVGYSVEILTP